ncbi:MAG TPA: FliI/YscN family ATPase [Albitalea sp.]|uniref:FliI/YscN family ATPase n=1 Tax=Piscinibacter sp. TaxID=1903157 RepID=UPI002ED1508E
MSEAARHPNAAAGIEQAAARLESARAVDTFGRVTRVVGPLVEAVVPHARIGEMCEIGPVGADSRMLLMEVIGFHPNGALLAPFGSLDGVGPGTRVRPMKRAHTLSVGSHLLGRVLDGFGQPPEGGVAPADDAVEVNVRGAAPTVHEREPITEPLPTGIRVLDGCLTLGRGQRIGVFAGPGCGKSTLMRAIANHAGVDVVVMTLIGERGREVAEMAEIVHQPEFRDRLIIVASTSDRAAAERIRAAYTATAIAEGFRRRGMSVMLMVDSLTRFARAVRETGVAAGEQTGRSGMPASVYAELPRLLERAGNAHGGSITALYFVLVEGAIQDDPIAEEVRSIVDGHVVLRRELGDRGIYPAISVLESLSRIMSDIVDRGHMGAAHRLRGLLAKYEEIELLLRLGEIKPGLDREIDTAVAAHPEIMSFLKQDIRQPVSFEEAVRALQMLAHKHGGGTR